MDQRATNGDGSGSDEPPRDPDPSPPRLSRRDFATRFGAGSAAAVGMAWASPHISTVRFARKAQVGSPPPGTSTTTSSTIAPPEGHIELNTVTPCEGDICSVRADGFAPRTAVTLELDSPEHTLGVTTAGVRGRINVTVRLPSGLTGDHVFVVVGVRPGGRTLSLTVPVKIKTAQECQIPPQGSTTTTTQPPGSTTTTRPGNRPTTTVSPSTSVPPSTSVAPANTQEGGGGGGGVQGASNGGGFLAFTGTDSVDLALLGAAAAVGGRALFGLVAHRDDEDEDED
jgi:hypothetical protein